jgi:hypothetical protein
VRDEKEDPNWDMLLIKIATASEDQPQYERIRKGLIKVLRKFGGYEPAVDDIHIEHILKNRRHKTQTPKDDRIRNAPTRPQPPRQSRPKQRTRLDEATQRSNPKCGER